MQNLKVALSCWRLVVLILDYKCNLNIPLKFKVKNLYVHVNKQEKLVIKNTLEYAIKIWIAKKALYVDLELLDYWKRFNFCEWGGVRIHLVHSIRDAAVAQNFASRIIGMASGYGIQGWEHPFFEHYPRRDTLSPLWNAVCLLRVRVYDLLMHYARASSSSIFCPLTDYVYFILAFVCVYMRQFCLLLHMMCD